MTNNILFKFFIAIIFAFSSIQAQDEQDVDAIEKARQAKEAAEKAAAEASAATEAAIEAAAQKAAKEARVEAKRKKEEEEARKLAEAKAAEEAELDAAATAAAEEAKRKMAEELGLEYESPEETVAETDTTIADTTASEGFVAKEPLGINVGVTGSVGFINGEYLTNTPTGGSVVITTPFGFKLGAFDFQVSVALGSYFGESSNGTFSPFVAGVGGNLTLAQFIFYEGHVGLVGAGLGGRGFGGVSLERLMKKGLNLPFNVLIGGEGFLSTQPDENAEEASYWGGLGVRLDYNF